MNRSFENGQGLIEYALIMLLVALAVIIILALLGPAIGNIYSNLIPLL
jgi:pilus assembly protein Flp/PilA